MSGPFDKELELIATTHTQDFARKLAQEVATLILTKLGLDARALTGASPAPGAPRSKKGQKPSLPPKTLTRKLGPAAAPARPRDPEDRTAALEKVFKVIQARDGVAVADIVKATSLERSSVAAALKALKLEGRICMGGSRRFSRYALTQPAADQASETARKGQ